MDIFHLFDFLTSESESERNQAYEAFEELLKNPHLYSHLFDILSTPNHEQKYYILASECLIKWFRQSISSIGENEQIEFVKKIQSFLLTDHPAKKEIWYLYSVTFNRILFESHITFLADSINLISLESPPEILALALKLSSLTSFKTSNSVHKSIRSQFEELFTEINNRLIPILQNAQEFLSSPIGCKIIKHSFKTIFYSTKKCQFNVELFPLISQVLHLILQNFSNIEDKRFCSLVGFCYRVIYMFRIQSSNPVLRSLELTEDQKESLKEEMNSLILQFIVSLAPYHLNVIDNFLRLPNFNSSIIPESADFAQVIIEIATLTEADLSDYYENPSIFYECAYPLPEQSCTRRLIYDLVSNKCHDSETYEIVHNIISQPPSESVIYLIGSTIREIMFSELQVDDEVFQWIIELANQQIPFQSPLIMSTYLYLVSKAAKRILSDEFLDALAPLVYKIVILSVMEEDEIKNDFGDESTSYSASKEFIVECSKSLVTVTNAVRLARKMIDQRSTEFPPEMLYSVVKLIPNFPTSDAAQFVNSFIINAHSMSNTNSEKKDFFMSQVESIKLNLCESAMAAASSASAFQNMYNISSSHKNEELNDFEIIANTLDTLNEIILCEGESPNVTDEIVTMIESLFNSFDQQFSKELNKLIKTLFNIGFPGSSHIMGVLTETIDSNHDLFSDLIEFYFIYVKFMALFRNDFIEMNMAPTVATFGVKTIQTVPNINKEDDINIKISIGLDLICFSIQTDQNFDVSPYIQFVEEQSQENSDFFDYGGIIIMMSIVISRPQVIQDQENLLSLIIEWVGNGNAKCPYKKRLAALSLMILNCSDDVMAIIVELLSKEKEQRELLAKGAEPVCYCCIESPIPIEQIDLTEIAQNAVKSISPDKQKDFMDFIMQL